MKISLALTLFLSFIGNVQGASMLRFDFTAVMDGCLVSCMGNDFEDIYLQTVTGSMLVPVEPQGQSFGNIEYLLGPESRFSFHSGVEAFDVENGQLRYMGISDNQPCDSCVLPEEDVFFIGFRGPEYRYQLTFRETPLTGLPTTPGGQIISGTDVPSPHEISLFPVIEFAIVNDEMPCCSNPGMFTQSVDVQVTLIPEPTRVPIPPAALFVLMGVMGIAPMKFRISNQ